METRLHPQEEFKNRDGLSELKNLYRNLGYVTLFAHARLAHAPYRLLEEFVPRAGRILDLGCGYGLFANYLSMKSPAREVIGIELSRRKLRYANRGLNNVRFIEGDVTQTELGSCDCIVMNHLLHHLRSFEEQEKILALCREILEPNGRLLICEVDRQPRWKFRVAQAVDALLYFGDRIYYREADEFSKLFRSLGFRVEQIMEAHQGVPMSHIIYSLSKG